MLVPDLMDMSRVEAAGAATEGLEVVAAPDAGHLVEMAAGARAVLVDLSAEGALGVPASLAGVIAIGFGSHVDRDLLRSAREAGYDRVLARSAFFGGLAGLLGGLAG